MLLFTLFMRLLVIVFLAGVAGSLVVVTLSFVEDLQELLGE
jgi:hypothetical protein